MKYAYFVLAIIFALMAFLSITTAMDKNNTGTIVIGLGIISAGFAISSAIVKKN